MIEVFCPKDAVLTDAQILSFWEMIFVPAQVEWDYESTSTSAQKSPDQVLHFFRETLIPRMDGLAYWAQEREVVVGMALLNRRTGPADAHCAKLGFSVRTEYQRPGIGYRLVCAVPDKARDMGIERIESCCFANNVPAIGPLRKVGFCQEGLRVGAVRKNGELRDICEFGLLMRDAGPGGAYPHPPAD
jgi:RimJ/RimL family protein N-acetyltransferase